MPHGGEVPLGRDPHVDVDPAVARRLREAGHPEVRQQLARDAGDAYGVAEGRARLRVEVDPQLVGVVDVIAPDRPGVEGQRAHVGAPHRHRDLGRADLVGGAAGREGDGRRLEVVGSPLGHPLLVERVGVAVLRPGRELHPRTYAGRPPLQRRRSVPQRAHQAVLDAREVLRDHQLGDLAGRVRRLVDHAIGRGDADLPVTGLHHHRLRSCHDPTLAGHGAGVAP